jgi:hypothetical protein
VEKRDRTFMWKSVTAGLCHNYRERNRSACAVTCMSNASVAATRTACRSIANYTGVLGRFYRRGISADDERLSSD